MNGVIAIRIKVFIFKMFQQVSIKTNPKEKQRIVDKYISRKTIEENH